MSLLRDIGAALSPFNAFLFLQGLETLHLRMERHSANALASPSTCRSTRRSRGSTTRVCASHPTPRSWRRSTTTAGCTARSIGFGIKGGREAGRRFIESTQLLSHLANIGDAKSLVHPSGDHDALAARAGGAAPTGVTDDFVRLSIGIEYIEDIIADIEQALAKA